MFKSTLLWIFAVLFTIGIAVYQRVTGPTYPVKGSVEIGNHKIDYKLLRSHESNGDAPVTIEVPDESFSGYVEYVRFKSGEEPKKVPMKFENGKLVSFLPSQPPAGKIAYDVYLEKDGRSYKLSEDKTVIRFKGAVPGIILIPHILFMFIAMLFSTRTGIEALVRGKHLYAYTLTTVVTLFVGGLLLGPFVQEYAFGDFWTGWPFGKDLTDNKTLVAFIFWLIAFFRVRKNKKHRTWVILAAVMLLAVYLIPHSMFGSELDYNTGQVETGKN